MRFLLGTNGLIQVPDVVEKAVVNVGNSVILNWIHLAGMWLAHSGLPLVTEGLLCWALFCFLMAIATQGKWMQRGVKSIIGFALLGVVGHAF